MTMPHILIVDDDPALLEALPEALRLRLGDVDIDTCDSAMLALEQVASCDYDAVVTDIKMPGMDGLALLNRIHEKRPETPTLMITGHGEHDLAVQALRGGAYDFIQKPIDRDYFVASLQRAIQVRRLRREVEEQQRALERHAATLEQVVEERTRELREANEAKDLFLSIASHELKTPLTTLKTMTQLTRRRLEKTGASETQFLATMERAIQRLETLVHDLLDTARITSGKLTLRQERVDLIDLCQQVVAEQQMAGDREITLQIQGKLPDVLEMDVDRDRMGQVLTNLLSNAVKYSEPGQPVMVTMRKAGDEVVIAVRDRGPGIPPEHLPYIFDQFYQVTGTDVQTGSRIGLGLGLYISRDIVERHGGRIWAESEVGKGSTFSLALPLARQLAGVEGPSAAGTANAR